MRPALRLLAEERGRSESAYLLLAGENHPLLSPQAVVQPHRGLRLALSAPDWDGETRFDEVHVLATPSREETLAYLGLARRALNPGGSLYLAVENGLGADGYRKRLKPLSASSKHHCRLLQLSREQLPAQADPRSLFEPYAGADFVSCPGLFSWDRLDPGSRLLLEFMPVDLRGAGADLGCGPGLLARELLKRGPTQLDAVDVDQRAVEACRLNCRGDKRLRPLWLDLALERPPGSYAWVALNPPFHGQGKELRGLGVALLHRAVEALGRHGRLWLVANQHLPYHQVLAQLPVTTVKEEAVRGYKLWECRKNV